MQTRRVVMTKHWKLELLLVTLILFTSALFSGDGFNVVVAGLGSLLFAGFQQNNASKVLWLVAACFYGFFFGRKLQAVDLMAAIVFWNYPFWRDSVNKRNGP
jgi:hypothetical protein